MLEGENIIVFPSALRERMYRCLHPLDIRRRRFPPVINLCPYLAKEILAEFDLWAFPVSTLPQLIDFCKIRRLKGFDFRFLMFEFLSSERKRVPLFGSDLPENLIDSRKTFNRIKHLGRPDPSA